MDDAELTRAVQRWRRAEVPREVADAADALALGLRRRGAPRDRFAAALRALGEAPPARLVERLAYLAEAGLGDPRLETPGRPRGVACGPAGAPVMVAVSDGELARVAAGGGALEPVELPAAARARVEFVGLDYDAAGDLWWVVRPRQDRSRIRCFRLPGGRGPVEEGPVYEVEPMGRRPAMVMGLGPEPGVLVETDNRQVWLHDAAGATRLRAVEPRVPSRIASGPGPGLMALVLWRPRDGPALHVALLNRAGEVVESLDLDGLPDLFHWNPDGTLHMVGVDAAPRVTWSRARGVARRPWLGHGPRWDQESLTQIWREADGRLWDIGPTGLRSWPDAGVDLPSGEVVPAGPWLELDGLLLDAPRGRLVGWGFAGEAAAWDLETGERLFLLDERDEFIVSVLGDGRVVLVGRAGVRVHAADGRGPPKRLAPEHMQVEQAAPGAAPGEVLLLGAWRRDEGGLVRWVEVDTGEVRGEVPGPLGARAARAGGFVEGGRVLWVAWQRDGGSEVVLHDAASGGLLARHDLGLQVVDSRMIVPHPDGEGLVLPREGGPAYMARATPASPLLADRDPPDFGMPVGFDPSGAHLAWFGPAGLEVLELATGARWVPVEPLEDLTRPVVVLDGRRLAVARGRRVGFLELRPSGPQ